MERKRRSHEPGDRSRFLVVVDTDARDRAVHSAARRAARTGATLAMPTVVEPNDFQQWLGLGESMKDEAQTRADHPGRHHRSRIVRPIEDDDDILASFDQRVGCCLGKCLSGFPDWLSTVTHGQDLLKPGLRTPLRRLRACRGPDLGPR
jgi:hypothetical protein